MLHTLLELKVILSIRLEALATATNKSCNYLGRSLSTTTTKIIARNYYRLQSWRVDVDMKTTITMGSPYTFVNALVAKFAPTGKTCYRSRCTAISSGFYAGLSLFISLICKHHGLFNLLWCSICLYSILGNQKVCRRDRLTLAYPSSAKSSDGQQRRIKYDHAAYPNAWQEIRSAAAHSGCGIKLNYVGEAPMARDGTARDKTVCGVSWSAELLEMVFSSLYSWNCDQK